MKAEGRQSDLRLGGGARLWLRLGRLLSPLSAAMAFAAGIAVGNSSLRRRAREVLVGKLSLAGPSKVLRAADGTMVRAGVFNDAALSDEMNLEVSSDELDRAYVERLGPKRDLALVLRGMWAAMLNRGAAKAPPSEHFNLFDVVINNSETGLILKTIESISMGHPNLVPQLLGDAAAERVEPAHVCFVNANNLNLAVERPAYRKILRAADLVLPDGIGVKIALQMAGGSLRRNLNGTDLFHPLAEMFAQNGWPVYLLGATNEVLERAAAAIQRRHPSLAIAGMHDGYFERGDEPAIARDITASGAVGLIIGMGTPRQEAWYAANASHLGVPVVFCMGGLLDFLGGKNRRAPFWMRQAGLEWVYRIVQEPGRMWKRYLVGNPVFLWRTSRWLRRRRARA